MINLEQVKRYCPEHFKEIENFEQAINDKRKTWVCHHRNGEQFSTEWLIANNMYFNRKDPHEFKFVTRSEHNTIHSKGRKLSESFKQANSIAHKGKTPTKNKTWSEFGAKFKEHFGITCTDNKKLYLREHKWYLNHNKVCRWEA